MKRKTKIAALIWAVPFVAGAVCQFLPLWLAVPSCLSLAIVYAGAWVDLGDEIRKEKEQGETK